MRTVVVSDIHGNGRALKAAVARCDELAPDKVVILGDLLTYGPDVEQVFHLLRQLESRYATTWVKGNHEELYDDLERGETAYAEGLPPWIRHSVDHTRERLDIKQLLAIPWVDEHHDETTLFAHANPWGSWRYINSAGDHREAAESLRQRGYRAGVFGHTHRSRMYLHPAGTGATDDHPLTGAVVDPVEVMVVNAGSVGQPRNKRSISTLLCIDDNAMGPAFEVHALDYDVVGHVGALMQLQLPDATRQKLATFFAPRD